ncbi:hypothetical protein IMSAGC022_00707 [Alistipes sp.]|nr:hypothetical protein IMSAGC022_00707 [Alistipes sp.]
MQMPYLEQPPKQEDHRQDDAYRDSIKLENGCLEGVCSDKMTFADLTITTNGLKFHMTTVTRDRFII